MHFTKKYIYIFVRYKKEEKCKTDREQTWKSPNIFRVIDIFSTSRLLYKLHVCDSQKMSPDPLPNQIIETNVRYYNNYEYLFYCTECSNFLHNFNITLFSYFSHRVTFSMIMNITRCYDVAKNATTAAI